MDSHSENPPSLSQHSSHIIVFGNEKGGCGKSTAAMHSAIGLLRLGYKVGTLDLDARQGTLTRYLRNRWKYVAEKEIALPDPFHMMIDKSAADTVEMQQAEERNFMEMALAELKGSCDFIVVDTPGTDSHLSRLAHARADTIVTPLNDSFIDLDMIVDLEPDTYKAKGPSVYTKMVMEQRKIKQDASGTKSHWIVMRNRRSHLNMKNKRDIQRILEALGEAFDFTFLEGFGERVIYRELFLKGLSVCDLKEMPGQKKALTLSEITARQEVRHLLLNVLSKAEVLTPSSEAV